MVLGVIRVLVANRQAADLFPGGVVVLPEMGDFLLQMTDGLVIFLNAILHRLILSLHLSPVVLHLLNAIAQLDVLELDHSVQLDVVLEIRDL